MYAGLWRLYGFLRVCIPAMSVRFQDFLTGVFVRPAEGGH